MIYRPEATNREHTYADTVNKSIRWWWKTDADGKCILHGKRDGVKWRWRWRVSENMPLIKWNVETLTGDIFLFILFIFFFFSCWAGVVRFVLFSALLFSAAKTHITWLFSFIICVTFFSFYKTTVFPSLLNPCWCFLSLLFFVNSFSQK